MKVFLKKIFLISILNKYYIMKMIKFFLFFLKKNIENLLSNIYQKNI